MSLEAHDALATAKPVPSAGWATTLVTPGVVDWFRLTLQAGRMYQANFPATDELDWGIFTRDSVVYSGPSASYWSMDFNPQQDDTLFVRIGQSSTVRTDTIQADVRIREIRDDLNEPANDRLSGATALAMDSTTTIGRIAFKDRDWFRFQADSGTVCSFDLDGLSNSRTPSLRVFSIDSIEQPLSFRNGGRIDFVPGRTGEWYMSAAGPGTDILDWSLEAVCHPLDRYEDDDGPSRAAILRADGMAQERNLSEEDEDWIALDLDSGVAYRLGTSSEGVLHVGILRQDSTEIVPWFDVPAGTHPQARLIVPKRSERVSLVVRPRYYVGMRPMPYTVWVRPAAGS